MKLLFKILLVNLIILNGSSFAEDFFVTGFEDLPLMSGLQSSEDAIYFDTPTGRIVESYAYSNRLSQTQVSDFYSSTLPQLGWEPSTNNVYIREGETLIIEPIIKDEILNVKFFLQPKN